jgi:hypothetical protein
MDTDRTMRCSLTLEASRCVIALAFQNGLIDPVQEKETDEQEDQPNIVEHTAKMWKIMTDGLTIQQM